MVSSSQLGTTRVRRSGRLSNSVAVALLELEYSAEHRLRAAEQPSRLRLPFGTMKGGTAASRPFHTDSDAHMLPITGTHMVQL